MSTEINLTIIALYFGLFLIGAAVLHREVFVNLFRNYVTSVFVIIFVVLLLFVPLLIQIFFGAAKSIVTESNIDHDRPAVYFIYALCAAAVILPQAYLTFSSRPGPANFRDRPFAFGQSPDSEKYLAKGMAYLCLLVVGWFLYVKSTGMGLIELMEASRFSWSATEGHMPLVGVIADYILAVAPVFLFYMAVSGKRSYWLIFIGIAVLVGYGLCSKDRKWLINIISGLWGAYYILNSRRIPMRPVAILTIALLMVPLIFWQVLRDTVFNYALGNSQDLQGEALVMATRLLRNGDATYYYHASIEAAYQVLYNDIQIPFALIRRQIFFFLPAQFSGGLKPEDISALFSDVVHGGSDFRRGNMPPGFFGLFLLSFNWFGAPFVLALIPFFLRFLDRVATQSRGIFGPVILAMSFSSILLLLRGDDSGSSYFVIFNLLVASLIFGILGAFNRATSSSTVPPVTLAARHLSRDLPEKYQ